MDWYRTEEAIEELAKSVNRVFKLLSNDNVCFDKYLTTMNNTRKKERRLACLKIIDNEVVSFNSYIPLNLNDVWVETNEIDWVFDNGRVY